ncbi:plectin-like [Rhincodon typus]|uniref:plectin-like n=1 Tax=Rhincodon typus TaxID=259920 RepID=UPI00202F591C|nr:plectin-like [Rhincodon typus]
MEPENSSKRLYKDTAREAQQLEVFERWINYHLEKRQLSRRSVNVLQDLQDGEFFIIFLEALTGDLLPRITGLWFLLTFFTYWRRKWNLAIAFTYLEQQQINLGNISINEILSGNPDVILQLMGNLVAHYEVIIPEQGYSLKQQTVFI